LFDHADEKFPSLFERTPGSLLEVRLDGDIPLYRDIFRVQPYALLGLNLGYNTTAYYEIDQGNEVWASAGLSVSY
jgi:hypothetical protein